MKTKDPFERIARRAVKLCAGIELLGGYMPTPRRLSPSAWKLVLRDAGRIVKMARIVNRHASTN